MFRKTLCLALVSVFTLPVPAQTPPPPTDADVLKGIALVEEGDYDGAIFTLDKAARRLAESRKQPSDLSQAYLYLGIAYVGKGHEAAAKAKFKEALAQIRDLTLSADRFPPKVINAFEAAKEEAARAAPAPTTRAAQEPAAAEKKGGGGGKILLIVGGLAAAGGVAAAAGGGGGSDSPAAPTTTTQPPDPRRTETFTGTLCSYESRNTCDYFREFGIVVTTAGTLDASVTWGDPGVLFTMELADQNYSAVAVSNRITNTNSTLTASVTPQTACSSCSYHLSLTRQDSLGPSEFTLTVRHP